MKKYLLLSLFFLLQTSMFGQAPDPDSNTIIIGCDDEGSGTVVTATTQFISTNGVLVEIGDLYQLNADSTTFGSLTQVFTNDYDWISTSGDFSFLNYGDNPDELATLITLSNSNGGPQTVTFGAFNNQKTLVLQDGETETFVFNGVTGWQIQNEEVPIIVSADADNRIIEGTDDGAFLKDVSHKYNLNGIINNAGGGNLSDLRINNNIKRGGTIEGTVRTAIGQTFDNGGSVYNTVINGVNVAGVTASTSVPRGADYTIAYNTNSTQTPVLIFDNPIQEELDCYTSDISGPLVNATPYDFPSFTLDVAGDYTFTYLGENINQNGALLYIGTALGGSNILNTTADRLTPTEPSKDYTVSLNAGIEYFVRAQMGGGVTGENFRVFTPDCITRIVSSDLGNSIVTGADGGSYINYPEGVMTGFAQEGPKHEVSSAIVVGQSITTGHDLNTIDATLRLSFSDVGVPPAGRPWPIAEIDVAEAVRVGSFFVWNHSGAFMAFNITDATTGTITPISEASRQVQYLNSCLIARIPAIAPELDLINTVDKCYTESYNLVRSDIDHSTLGVAGEKTSIGICDIETVSISGPVTTTATGFNVGTANAVGVLKLKFPKGTTRVRMGFASMLASEAVTVSVVPDLVIGPHVEVNPNTYHNNNAGGAFFLEFNNPDTINFSFGINTNAGASGFISEIEGVCEFRYLEYVDCNDLNTVVKRNAITDIVKEIVALPSGSIECITSGESVPLTIEGTGPVFVDEDVVEVGGLNKTLGATNINMDYVYRENNPRHTHTIEVGDFKAGWVMTQLGLNFLGSTLYADSYLDTLTADGIYNNPKLFNARSVVLTGDQDYDISSFVALSGQEFIVYNNGNHTINLLNLTEGGSILGITDASYVLPSGTNATIRVNPLSETGTTTSVVAGTGYFKKSAEVVYRPEEGNIGAFSSDLPQLNTSSFCDNQVFMGAAAVGGSTIHSIQNCGDGFIGVIQNNSTSNDITLPANSVAGTGIKWAPGSDYIISPGRAVQYRINEFTGFAHIYDSEQSGQKEVSGFQFNKTPAPFTFNSTVMEVIPDLNFEVKTGNTYLFKFGVKLSPVNSAADFQVRLNGTVDDGVVVVQSIENAVSRSFDVNQSSGIVAVATVAGGVNTDVHYVEGWITATVDQTITISIRNNAGTIAQGVNAGSWVDVRLVD